MRTSPALSKVLTHFESQPRRWLVTGAAGFIGSHLVEHLLQIGQQVRGLDNFATGSRGNLENVQARVGDKWKNFEFNEGDICNAATCATLASGCDVVLHHAALGSVPRSIANPKASHEANVSGFLNVLIAAKDAAVRRVIFASSSSVYGDNQDLPKLEDKTGQPLSPYAVTKVADELYGRIFASTYNMQIIGLRYFNVFGPRQNPYGPYAAVIPRWIESLTHGQPLSIHGDGSTSRDFCYVKNVVQMNLLAAASENPEALNRVYNTACDARTTLKDILSSLQGRLKSHFPQSAQSAVEHEPRRAGDILHSQASIQLARHHLGYEPQYGVQDGLDETVAWYVERAR